MTTDKTMIPKMPVLKVNTKRAIFPLGRLVATPGALKAASPDEMVFALSCHVRGNWGDVDEHDWKANDDSLVNGLRLLSSYHTKAGEKFWVITEADRSVTTLLLPDEY